MAKSGWYMGIDAGVDAGGRPSKSPPTLPGAPKTPYGGNEEPEEPMPDPPETGKTPAPVPSSDDSPYKNRPPTPLSFWATEWFGEPRWWWVAMTASVTAIFGMWRLATKPVKK